MRCGRMRVAAPDKSANLAVAEAPKEPQVVAQQQEQVETPLRGLRAVHTECP